MTRRREAVWIGLGSLAALYLFFLPLLPPMRAFQLVGDIEGYHYPLLNYAFKSLHEGRFPLWDPTIYCGLSFAGNIQAQLFYPFTWVLFASQWRRQGLSFLSIQIFDIVHLWILLQFAYWWLRDGRRLPAAASALGAMTFALTGYLLNDLQHLGVICGLAWFPLALWGVDRRRAWMIAVAGALAFLAGYPATWIAIAVGVFFHALFTAWRYAIPAGLAMLFSLPLAGIQLLPALELSRFRPPEQVYRTGPPLEWNWLRFYPAAWPEGQYLYYGAAFLLAIAFAVWGRSYRRFAAPVALAAIGWIFLQNPFQIVSFWAVRIPSLADVMQHWNFQAVLSAAAAWFTALAWAKPAASHPRLVFCLLPLFLMEQYWFGGTRPLLRERQNHARFFAGDARIGGPDMRGVDPAAYKLLRSHPEFRVLADDALHGVELRHYGLSVPNGFDPFLPKQYRAEIEQFQPFETNRLFRVPVNDEAMLKALAVRFVIAPENAPSFPLLAASPVFRLIQPAESYFRIFEYTGAEPAYRFAHGAARILHWSAERREFHVNAFEGGDFVLIEQNLPGWRAFADGVEQPIGVHSKAFQKVRIATAGEHTIRFEYRPSRVWQGALVTALSLAALLVLARWRL